MAAIDVDALLEQVSVETGRLQSSLNFAPPELKRIADQTLQLQREVLTDQQVALLRSSGKRLRPAEEARRAELIDWIGKEIKALQSLSNAIARHKEADGRTSI